MSTLRGFETTLAAASRALYAEAEAARAPSPGDWAGRRLGRWGLLRRVRQLGVGVQLVLALSTVSTLATGGTLAWIFLSAGHTNQLASVECNVTHNSQAIIDTVTGDPITDCAITWPSATAGRHEAPPLTAWGLANNTKTAVVQPTSWGQPFHGADGPWRRLPAGWSVNLPVVELTDQLNDIASPLSGTPMTASGGPACSYAGADERAVRALLAADGLSSWHVRVSPNDRGRAVSTGCRLFAPNIDGDTRTVQLIQFGPERPYVQTPQQHRIANAAAVTDRKLLAIQQHLNRDFARRCESVAGAVADWTKAARSAGFRPTSLSYYRAINDFTNPVSSQLSNDYYTLVKQPRSQHTGPCAHILVMRAGGGSWTVYAARITP